MLHVKKLADVCNRIDVSTGYGEEERKHVVVERDQLLRKDDFER